jgi:5-methylcytosine-specific restriction endonuclease McrA
MKAENRRKELLALQNWRCCWCGKPLTLEFATIEHIIPKVMGGSLSLDNTAVAHGLCNKQLGRSIDLPPFVPRSSDQL